jgi:hypothetical protein
MNDLPFSKWPILNLSLELGDYDYAAFQSPSMRIGKSLLAQFLIRAVVEFFCS